MRSRRLAERAQSQALALLLSSLHTLESLGEGAGSREREASARVQAGS